MMHRLKFILVGLALLLGVLWALLWSDSALEAPANWPTASDPALGFYTKGHSASYAGMDRWAQQGMLVTPIVNLLKKQDYVCQVPQGSVPGNPPNGGTHELRCTKDLHWPISRSLTIQASINYDLDGRLIAANGASRIAGNPGWFKKWLVSFLRNKSWIEAETLQVRGFEFDHIDTVISLVSDALLPSGWHATCEDGLTAPVCESYATDRRKSGFAPVPAGSMAAGNAMEIHYAMERIHLMPEYPNTHPGDALKLRVGDGQMWVDFIGTDLVGHKAIVSIAFDSEGGKPINMLVQLKGQSKSVVLAGKNHLANDGSILYLAPEAGPQMPKIGMWLSMPDQNRPVTIERLSQNISHIDPVFIPRIFKAALTSAMTATTPELDLGLYPVLRTIEDKAKILRALHADRWLPTEQSVALLSQVYENDAVALAAWALSLCAANDEPMLAETACWQRFALNNPNMINLLRQEVAGLSTIYAALDASHPLRIHLKKWSMALRQD